MIAFTNQTIVVPFDFSDASRDAVEKVIEWSDASNRIHLIHVVNSHIGVVSLDPSMPIPPPVQVETQASALKLMQEQLGDEKYQRIKIHCEIGNPGNEIANLAETIRADMIIMPSHGRTGISRLLLGSVAERVLRLAHCPVLILRDGSIPSE